MLAKCGQINECLQNVATFQNVGKMWPIDIFFGQIWPNYRMLVKYGCIKGCCQNVKNLSIGKMCLNYKKIEKCGQHTGPWQNMAKLMNVEKTWPKLTVFANYGQMR